MIREEGFLVPSSTRMKRTVRLWQLLLLFIVLTWNNSICTATNNVFTFTIPEEQPKGTLVGNPFVNSGIYDVLHGTPNKRDFQIDQTSGKITTSVILDREKVPSGFYNLTINDFKDFQKVLTYFVLIYVQDINDNSPKFVVGNFDSVTLYEGHSSLRYKIIAADPDNGINSTQSYSIISGNVDDVFKLNIKREPSGNLYADLVLNDGKELDRETKDFYVLNISASDGGVPPRKDFLQLNITVSDLNDNPPVFTTSNYTVFVPEDVKVSTSIVKVSATDKDIGTNKKIYYYIISSDPNNEFSIDKNTGVISPNIKLDYETKKAYKLSVKAENTDSPTNKLFAVASVNIIVKDINDNDPIVSVSFSKGGPYQVYENAKVGEEVARVSVSDADSGSNGEVNVTLEGGDGYFSMKFDVQSSESVIYVGKKLDRETHSEFILTASCVDNGSPLRKTTKKFKINVGDINDNYPVFERHLYTSRVFENATVGTVIASVSATDKDIGVNKELVYSFANSTKAKPYSKWFHIDSVTGVITTVTAIDREQVAIPLLTVIASDKGTPPLQGKCTVIINITDTNDNDPSFNQSLYVSHLVENAPSSMYILHVYAEDPDLGHHSLIKYTLSNSVSVPFKIDPNSGAIFASSTIDHELNSMYSFQVIAIDGGGRKAYATVNVTIVDQNDNNPMFNPELYHAEVKEDVKVGTAVVTVIANDKDSGVFSKLTYSILNGNNDGLFDIGTSTGTLTVAKKLDRETKESHLLLIGAFDGGGKPATNNATVNITVLDVNDEPPIFEHSSYNYTIKENSQPQILGTVKATSNDVGINAQITYSIIAGNVDNHFTINSTGTLYLRTPIDHETTRQVKLTVQAADGGNPPMHSEVAVTIQVLDLNDNAPVFRTVTAGEIRVPENSIVGTAFFNLTAVDKDSDANGRITYSIIGGDGKDFFVIDPVTGLLKTNDVFDYETKSSYSLHVKAVDGGSPPLQKDINITVYIGSVDEFLPVFPEKGYSFEVPGNAMVGDVIGTVSATDRDGGEDGKVYYSFVDPSSDALRINRTSGVITVNRTLNDGSSLQQQRKRRSIDFFEDALIGSRSRSRRAAEEANLNMKIQADSGKPNSKKATTSMSVKVDYTCPGCAIVTKGKQTGGDDTNDRVIIVALAVLAGVLLLSFVVVLLFLYVKRKRKRKRKNPRLKFDGSFDEITVHPSSGNSNHGAVSAESIPTRAYPQEYTPLTKTTDNSNNASSTDASETPGSASSGRGSSDGDYEESPKAYVNGDIGSVHSDNFVKTIVPDSGIQENDDDRISQLTISDGSGILHHDDSCKPYKNDKILSKMDFQSQESMHVFGEEGGGEADGGHENLSKLLYAKMAEVDGDDESISESPRRYNGDRGLYAGSLSSIIGSKEELSGSYNWDYLLDWGPQFQPLAEVFHEIGRMKDDSSSSGQTRPGIVSIPSSTRLTPGHLPGMATTDMLSSVSSLPRSPISPPSTQFTSPAFSPNFTPAITPLITRSPSVSPLDTATASPSFSPQGSRPASAHLQLGRTRADSQGDSNSELSHSPSISDDESNMEIEI